MAKNTICLWFDKNAEAAARFLLRDLSRQHGECRAPRTRRLSGGQRGRCVDGRIHSCGHSLSRPERGPVFKHNEAFSFQIATDDQEETDRYWNAIVENGGEESACGWCKDKWGISWQITPRVLTDALAAGGDEAKRAFEAMMTMRKIDVAAIEAARRG
ncbi:putative 3-demethylubiquinone-9 3-methyltransferase (glyoxalase superfamily) [Rhizobium mongolense]|uniref:Putative 3-demethylubiquinone-9 3-methyltransferase (Glyoxalase superfamily) n=1 Tax=Rhizobium mongolense TaxID=57676 RepID=A0A7W6RPP6_9HYPH|nr:putative 3-demethylubiquinone-9 3-methyltransferase (glyoxalase superfamily) [Rhizobium mongolense]